MPELPEIETIKRQLSKFLIGHTIEGVDVRYKKCFTGSPKDLVGGKVIKIRRFGKVLSIDLNNGYSIVIHIKLTGQLIYRGPNLSKAPSPSKKIIGGIDGKHTHLVFVLDRGGKLYYNDVRRFGWIEVVKSISLNKQIKFIRELGPEPLVDEQHPPVNILTLEKFKETLKRSGRSIKTLLMDQKKIAGVGNIYANEALWLSEISPKKVASKINEQEAEALFNAIENVLKGGIKRGGASELAFVTPDGTEGNYQKQFLAYGKEGEVCPRCAEGKFIKIKLGGRGTYYCPVCQQ